MLPQPPELPGSTAGFTQCSSCTPCAHRQPSCLTRYRWVWGCCGDLAVRLTALSSGSVLDKKKKGTVKRKAEVPDEAMLRLQEGGGGGECAGGGGGGAAEHHRHLLAAVPRGVGAAAAGHRVAPRPGWAPLMLAPPPLVLQARYQLPRRRSECNLVHIRMKLPCRYGRELPAIGFMS